MDNCLSYILFLNTFFQKPDGIDGGHHLLWNGSKMHQAGGNKTAASGSKDVIMPKVIYGEDDRIDEYEVQDASILAVGDSTAALVSRSELIDNGDGIFSLPTETYAEWYQRIDPIETGNPLWLDESRFAINQNRLGAQDFWWLRI